MPQMVTFPLDHPLRPAVEAAFAVGAFVAVASEGRGPRNCCYRNVDREIERNGGRGVIGWQIDWWPKLFVRALHHAVIERPSGALADVTSLDREDRTAITFAPVRVLYGCVEGTVPRLVPSRYFVIHDSPEVHEMIAASEMQREIKLRLDVVMRDQFGFLDNGEELVAPSDTAEAAFMEAHKDEMVLSVQRIDRAVVACEALAARLS